MHQPLLLLSDVDGTLLGDDGALPAPVRTLQRRVREVASQWPGAVHVGLASSRTLRELTVLQRALGLLGPCIAEDGARHALDVSTLAPGTTTVPPDTTESHGQRELHCWAHAASAQLLRDTMADSPAFVRADTLQRSMAALHALGFRTRGSVRRALEARRYSVLLDPQVWTPDELTALRDRSAARGLQLRRGGRWFTLTTAGGKGPALRALRHQLTRSGVIPVVAAIGNEENDQSLLADADCRFVIRNPHRGPHPVLSTIPGAVVLDADGIGGWMEMLDRLVPAATAVLAARSTGALR